MTEAPGAAVAVETAGTAVWGGSGCRAGWGPAWGPLWPPAIAAGACWGAGTAAVGAKGPPVTEAFWKRRAGK